MQEINTKVAKDYIKILSSDFAQKMASRLETYGHVVDPITLTLSSGIVYTAGFCGVIRALADIDKKTARFALDQALKSLEAERERL